MNVDDAAAQIEALGLPVDARSRRRGDRARPGEHRLRRQPERPGAARHDHHAHVPHRARGAGRADRPARRADDQSREGERRPDHGELADRSPAPPARRSAATRSRSPATPTVPQQPGLRPGHDERTVNVDNAPGARSTSPTATSAASSTRPFSPAAHGRRRTAADGIDADGTSTGQRGRSCTVSDEGRVLAGRYRVGALIGRGGMADVHVGTDTPTGPPGGHQAPEAAARHRPGVPHAVPPGGAVGRAHGAPDDRARLRRRRGDGHRRLRPRGAAAVHRHGVRRRPAAQGHHPRGSARARARPCASSTAC